MDEHLPMKTSGAMSSNMIIDCKNLLESSNNRLMHYPPEFHKFLEWALPDAEIKVLDTYKDGYLAGIFPLAIIRDPNYGIAVNSLPFFGSHGGPIASDDFSRGKLLEKFFDLVHILAPTFVTIIENPFDPLEEELLSRYGLEVVDDRIGQFTPLPTSIAAFHVKTRNAIRKGQRLEQIIEQRDDHAAWDWMQRVHERSIRAMGGIPKSMAVFNALRESFGENAQLWVGSLSDKLISGVLVIRYQDTIEYFTPVFEEEFRDTQALSATIFEIMQKSSESGASLWNWGGTWRSQEGVYRFKDDGARKTLPTATLTT